jgi:hypothetical protein
MALFNSTKRKSRLHYGTAKKARQTIKYLRTLPRGKQIQGAQAMMLRAKFHKHQTADMREAINLYKQFLKSIKDE